MPRRKAPEPKELTYKTPEELEIEAQTGHKLTLRQKRFAERFVEGDCSATQAAIEAGYSPRSAPQQAYKLLNPAETPQVVAYIAQMREDMEMRRACSSVCTPCPVVLRRAVSFPPQSTLKRSVHRWAG
jgi:hypothetical protein